MLIVVVLPAPLGPRKPNTSPGATSNSTPRTASISPKLLASPLTSIAASDILIFGKYAVELALGLGQTLRCPLQLLHIRRLDHLHGGEMNLSHQTLHGRGEFFAGLAFALPGASRPSSSARSNAYSPGPPPRVRSQSAA